MQCISSPDHAATTIMLHKGYIVPLYLSSLWQILLNLFFPFGLLTPPEGSVCVVKLQALVKLERFNVPAALVHGRAAP